MGNTPTMPLGEAILELIIIGLIGLVLLWILWAFITTTVVIATTKFWKIVGKMFSLPITLAKIAIEKENQPKQTPLLLETPKKNKDPEILTETPIAFMNKNETTEEFYKRHKMAGKYGVR